MKNNQDIKRNSKYNDGLCGLDLLANRIEKDSKYHSERKSLSEGEKSVVQHDIELATQVIEQIISEHGEKPTDPQVRKKLAEAYMQRGQSHHILKL